MQIRVKVWIGEAKKPRLIDLTVGSTVNKLYDKLREDGLIHYEITDWVFRIKSSAESDSYIPAEPTKNLKDGDDITVHRS